MRIRESIIAALLLTVLLASPVLALKRASAQWGGQLFRDPTFAGSANDKSCLSCHDNDKKMKQALRDMSREQMTEVINNCISGQLEGQPLAADSEELRALRMYFSLLADDCK